ncbi:lipoyl(octanoyl) transferase LipB [Buchnera aphidicola]|uniref:Octanoyltransferase n=1 Tax=Buchnera aphidicola subsp. Rhopalosiphum maidis TaxID=118109 RepID=A0A3G2I696_BUCRM|nr:lipoyl(octanoyl) transferase LipB [Buchnera aphidicola]AYN24930.1 lipoyl(octanoyl) transferase LipB [Buchnera aphidicola (Rhopalosiphum maidis)]
MNNKIIFFRNFGLKNWIEMFNKMHFFTEIRNINTFDEIWFLEHYPIFTQGLLRKKNATICNNTINNIPVVTTDRGGQITYHGPGQQILYFLIDLKRRKITIRDLINIMHTLIVETLNYFSIKANIKSKSPGVYVNDQKISSLGLRVKKGFTLHGLSLNVDMDLTPFNYINPCGDINIKMTQVKEFNSFLTLKEIRVILIKKLSYLLNVSIIEKKFSIK